MNKTLAKLIKNETFKKFVLKKCRYCSNGNIKLGKQILTWSKLYHHKEHEIADIMPGINVTCKGSCKKEYCNGCCNTCYVKKSYDLHGYSVKKGHAWRTLATRFWIDELEQELDGQLTRKRNKAEIIRLDQSGELETLKEFIMHVNIAKKHPETVFFIYTKAFDIVINYMLEHEHDFPKNFIILISIWNEYGIKEYNMVKHMDNVKAFVVRTGFDYKQYGIIPTCVCEAYINGKLNHSETCYKCKKCFDNDKKHKVILCDEH